MAFFGGMAEPVAVGLTAAAVGNYLSAARDRGVTDPLRTGLGRYDVPTPRIHPGVRQWLGENVVEPVGRATARAMVHAGRALSPAMNSWYNSQERLQQLQRAAATPVVQTAREHAVEPNPGPSQNTPIKKMKKKLQQPTQAKMAAVVVNAAGQRRLKAVREAVNAAAFAKQSAIAREARGIAPDMGKNFSHRAEKVDKQGNPIIYGSDYLQAAVVSDAGTNIQGGVLLQYNLNPQQVVTASLAQYSQLYQKFEFLRVGVEFASSEAFTYGGSINCLWDSDIGDVDGAGLKLVQQAATTKSAHECPILRSTIWWYNTRKEASGEYFVEQDLTSTAGSRQSIQGHCKVFLVNPISFPGAAAYPLTFGSFVVHYVVRFYHRQLDINQSVTGNVLGVQRSITSAAGDWLGQASTLVTNSAFNSYLSMGAVTNNASPINPGGPLTINYTFNATGVFAVNCSFCWGAATQTGGTVQLSLSQTGAATAVTDSGGMLLGVNGTTASAGAMTVTQLSTTRIFRVPGSPAGFNVLLTATTAAITLGSGSTNPRQFEMMCVPVDITGGITYIRPLRQQFMQIQAYKQNLATDESDKYKDQPKPRPSILHESILAQYAGVAPKSDASSDARSVTRKTILQDVPCKVARVGTRDVDRKSTCLTCGELVVLHEKFSLEERKSASESEDDLTTCPPNSSVGGKEAAVEMKRVPTESVAAAVASNTVNSAPLRVVATGSFAGTPLSVAAPPGFTATVVDGYIKLAKDNG